MRIRPIAVVMLLIGVSFLLQSVFLLSAGADEVDTCIAILRKKNYSQAAECFSIVAEKGNREAQAWLGSLYAEGTGVRQNYEEAARWLKRAADQGQKNSQNSLGHLYRDGKGVKQDFAEAAKWYSKAAMQGFPSAQSELGVFYLLGKGVPQDYDEAVIWFKKAADQGFAVAQVNLAYCYEFGMGVPLNYDEAVKWLHKAAAQGNKDAQSKLTKLESQKDRLNALRLSDAEYISIARIAEEKYKDCDTALNSYLEVSELGRKDPEWSLSAAKLFECVKNYKEALYYYRKYAALKPRQTRITEKVKELQSLIDRSAAAEMQNKGAAQSPAPASTGMLRSQGAQVTNPPQSAVRLPAGTGSPSSPQASSFVTKTEKCLVNCLQDRSRCGTAEKCRMVFGTCTEACQANDTWKNIAPAAGTVNVSDIRFTTFPDYTRVEIRLSDRIDFTNARILNPDRLFFDLKNCRIQKELQKTTKVDNDMLVSVRSSQFSESTVRVVLDLKEATDFKVVAAEDPSIIIYIYKQTATSPR